MSDASDAVMGAFYDAVSGEKCGGTMPNAVDLLDGEGVALAEEIAAIERATREMQEAEWERLADVAGTAERLGWRASMTIIDDEPTYIIETDGCHINVAPDEVEAFMRGVAWALGK